MRQGGPLVSVVIPVYNGANYLSRAIDSALAQTYAMVEVIVVNDGSTDNGATCAIAAKYGEKIRYFEKENGGVASALNFGIQVMKGEYFSWLSHDDEYLPDKIESQMALIVANGLAPDVVLYSDYCFITARSQVRGSYRVRFVPLRREEHVLPVFLHRLNGCTMLFHRQTLERCGEFNTSLLTTQDYDYWLRLSQFCRFHHQQQVTLLSREHPAQGSRILVTAAVEGAAFFINMVKNLSSEQRLELESYNRHYLTMLYIDMQKCRYAAAVEFLKPFVSPIAYLWLKFGDRSWRSEFSLGGVFSNPWRNLQLFLLFVSHCARRLGSMCIAPFVRDL